jgi:cytochrome c553
MMDFWIRRALATGLGILLGLTALATSASTAELEAKISLCASCHGSIGLPSDPSIPIIRGQEFYYLYVQLKDFKAGRRQNSVMSGIVAQLEDREQMKALAQHFAGQKWPSSPVSADDATVERAQRAISAGQCVQCHLGGFEGNSRVPRLAGQQVRYLEKTMLDFKNRIRLNSPSKVSLLKEFSEEDIAAMAQYLGAL